MTNYDYLSTCRYYGPPRGYTHTGSKKLYLAIHNTSNDATAHQEADYAKRRTDSVSSHFYVDKTEVVQSLDTTYQAWHAGSSSGNTKAIAFEFTGTNDKSRDWWMNNVNWPAIIDVVYRVCADTGITPQTLTDSELRAGSKTGIITHDQMRRVWGGTTHTDPGANFPLDYLITEVNKKFNPPQPPSGGTPEHPPTGGVQPPQTGDVLVTNWQTVENGDEGHGVKVTQALLNIFGYGLAEDGDFGSKTESAVRSFQGHHPPLDVDGEFGPKSLSMALYGKIVV